MKIDHNFNASHKFNVNYTFERFTASGQRGNYPGKENDWFSQTTRKPQVITSSFVSTLTPITPCENLVTLTNFSRDPTTSFKSRSIPPGF